MVQGNDKWYVLNTMNFKFSEKNMGLKLLLSWYRTFRKALKHVYYACD